MLKLTENIEFNLFQHVIIPIIYVFIGMIVYKLLKRIIENYKSLKKGLMQQLLTGKVDVNV